MNILDHFGNEIEVGDTVYCGTMDMDMIISSIEETPQGSAYNLILRTPSGESLHYLVFHAAPVARDLVVDVTKKEKEGAMKYHLLNSQIDGGS